MATTTYTITVKSDEYSDDGTVRGLVGALTNALRQTKGKAKRLSVTSTPSRWQGYPDKLTAKVTIVRDSSEVEDGEYIARAR